MARATTIEGMVAGRILSSHSPSMEHMPGSGSTWHGQDRVVGYALRVISNRACWDAQEE